MRIRWRPTNWPRLRAGQGGGCRDGSFGVTGEAADLPDEGMAEGDHGAPVYADPKKLQLAQPPS